MTANEPPGRPSADGRRSDLRLRVISSVVLAPIVLAIVWIGGWPFAALVILMAVLFIREWMLIVGEASSSPAAIAGYLTILAGTGCAAWGMPIYGIIVLVVGAGTAAWAAGKKSRSLWVLEGVAYSASSAGCLVLLRGGTLGLEIAVFILFVVWATDIAGYFVGRALGGPKLWLRVSPKKTWSGAVGGTIAGVCAGGLVALAFGLGQFALWIGLGALFSAVSQAGDLFESSIKRRFNVKDSGALIPGHGGVMDRVDGLVAVSIAAVLLGLALGGTIGDPAALLAVRSE